MNATWWPSRSGSSSASHTEYTRAAPGIAIGVGRAPVRLAPRRRVHQARDRLMKLDHRDAPLITRDARPDLIEPTLLRLGDEERVGDMGPRHAHQISVAGSEDLLGELDAIEPADRE